MCFLGVKQLWRLKPTERLLPWQKVKVLAVVLLFTFGSTLGTEAFAADQTTSATGSASSTSASGGVISSSTSASSSSSSGSKAASSKNAKAVAAAAGRELTIERSFSVSYIKVPTQCEYDSFKTTCTRLVNYYARRFEREMVSLLNYGGASSSKDKFIKAGTRSARERSKSVQHVSMSIYSPPEAPVMTMFSVFHQQINGEDKEHLLVETINFEVATGQSLKFAQLFENPDLAAMLCARAIEAKYTKYKSPLLPVVVSATELSPSNFIVTSKGLRFFFAPNLVKPNTTITDSMLVSLEKLQAAKPIAKWWNIKEDPQRTAKDRAALAKSSLRNVIRLEEDSEQEDATASSSANATAAAAATTAAAAAAATAASKKSSSKTSKKTVAKTKAKANK